VRPDVVVVMGVAGAGKTTVGRMLAHELGWSFADADGYHTPDAWAKMGRGEPLTDADRAPWLARLRAVVADHRATGTPLVVACSALKDRYRQALVPADAPHGAVGFVYLRVPPETTRARLAARRGHPVGPELDASQWATLEEPSEALWVDGTRSPAACVRDAIDGLGLARQHGDRPGEPAT